MTETISGRLVLDEGELRGHLLTDDDGRIAGIEPDPDAREDVLVVPGLIDVHVHGWGGHDAMDGPTALTGMARALARRGVTSFLPTSVSATFADLSEYAESVRRWMPDAPRRWRRTPRLQHGGALPGRGAQRCAPDRAAAPSGRPGRDHPGDLPRGPAHHDHRP